MKIRIFSCCIILLFIFSRCVNKEDEIIKSHIQYGGVFKLLISDPVENLDPLQIIYNTDWHVSSLIYEGLIGYGEKPDDIIPLIAEKWEKYEGGLRWIFSIRKGVRFQDNPCFKNGVGKECTANDVLFTFYRMADPNTECYNRDLLLEKIEGFKEYYSGKAKDISGIKVLDDYRIQFELTKPYYTFLKILASALGYIVTEEAVKYYGVDFKKNPVGTGAFKIAEWDALKGITLVKNENYWGKDENGNKLPYLNEIYVKTITNNFLLSTEFLKGECDLLFCDKVQYNKFISDTLINNKYNFYSLGSGTAVRFLGFSLNKNSPVNKKEFRQALDYIFASAEFSKDSIDNYIPAFTLVPPHLFSYSNSKTVYSDSIYKIIENFPTYYKKHPITILVSCELADIDYFENNLKRFGFNPKVNVQTLQYYEEIIKQRPDVFRVSMHPSFPDPEGYYFLFYSRSNESLNLSGYSNPEFDRVFELALVEQDIVNRNRLFVNLEKILKEDYPAIYISHEGTRYYALPKYINGFKLRLEIPDYKYIWINDDKHSAKP